jgi:uncharacterized protein
MSGEKPNAPARVVLDTNVLISALRFPSGISAKMRTLWMHHHVVPLVCTATAEELIRTLGYPKFRLNDDERHDLLADYLPWCEVVEIPAPPPRTPKSRDDDDVVFLQLAIAGKAKLLITGDSALLELRNRVGFKILTPAEFINAQ